MLGAHIHYGAFFGAAPQQGWVKVDTGESGAAKSPSFFLVKKFVSLLGIDDKLRNGGPMNKRRLAKDRYSELVVRNTLYWLTAYTEWTLDEEEDNWIVQLSSNDPSLQAKFDALLNDYLLREKLSLKTEPYRDAITSAVLKGITERLSS
ncbi:His-Xaa-Ser system protein HxsD [Spongiibacter tropicus]|uniref:His-Xaa-Ser system protein HxsD n=1 Tax=Spongiibacter tropicus TaxID=454602 RepID=UPI0035BE86AF